MEYYGAKGKLVKEKVLGEKCADKCRHRCSDISDTARQAIFDKFWAMGNRSEQWSVLTKYIKKTNVKTRTMDSTKPRSCTYIYFLPVINDNDTLIFGEGESQRVCKATFAHTFSVSDRVIRTAVAKMNKQRSFSDGRGRHNNHARVITGSMAESVCDHVMSFAPQGSGYSREDTNELCLDRSLSLTRMFRLYDEWFDPDKYTAKCTLYHQYRKIVHKNFKLRFTSLS